MFTLPGRRNFTPQPLHVCQKEVANALFGTSSSTSYTNPYGNQANTALSQLQALLSGTTSGTTGLESAAGSNLGTAATLLQSLASGNLPSSYTNAFQTTLNNQVENSLGNSVAKLVGQGTLGGSTLADTMKQISDSAANATAANYNQSMGIEGNLASGLGSIGASEGTLGLQQQQGLQTLLSALLGQGQTTVNQGSSGLLGGLISSGALNKPIANMISNW
ncbi:MAG: hypothetical protein P4N59_03365 [Negativicutes bacterium]|nr:hypothetical protein [Negativicutes bacterium]